MISYETFLNYEHLDIERYLIFNIERFEHIDIFRAGGVELAGDIRR